MTGDYTQALIDARYLINELRRQWLITAEEKKRILASMSLSLVNVPTDDQTTVSIIQDNCFR